MKRSMPIFLVGFGVLILFASLWLFLEPRANGRMSDSLPARIADLPLTQTTTGSEAISEVGDMHGQQFPIKRASIGHYGGHQITLWVAGAESDSVAAEMVTAMEARIGEGNSPFTPLEQIQKGGRAVYVLEGMGQRHYYFQSNSLVIWLAADPSLADQAINQALEVYP